MLFLGIDSSNYRSSAAVLCDDLKYKSNRKLLNVAQGERGLRQSDAVFLHTKQLPYLIKDLLDATDVSKIRQKAFSRSCFLVILSPSKKIYIINCITKALFFQ